MILHNPYPGILISNSIQLATYESYCVSLYSEYDLKHIVHRSLVVIPSNNNKELLRYINGVIRFTNTGERLTDGSDLILKQGTVFTGDPLPNTMFLISESTASLTSTFPPEEPYGVPITLESNAEYPFEGGSNGAIMHILVIYRRIVQLN